MTHIRDLFVFLIYSKLHIIYFLHNTIQLRAYIYQMYYFKLFAVCFKIYETCFTEINFPRERERERERERKRKRARAKKNDVRWIA